MLKNLNKIVLTIFILITSSLANASLITNGSFEKLTFDNNTTSIGKVSNINLQTFETKSHAWDVFEILPGWVTTDGNGIELQKNVVTTSANGNNHVELDSHPRGASNTVMTQSLNSLTIGAEYLLTFYYKPRTAQLNDNGINVFWYDAALDFDISMSAIFSTDLTSVQTPYWIQQSVSLKAQSETMDLSFGAFGTENSLGGLIDNISLVQLNTSSVTNVPEPSVLALSLLGFALLVRHQQNK